MANRITPAEEIAPVDEPLFCRICLEEQDQSAPPSHRLIQPCVCRGSLAHVHQHCITTWTRHQRLETQPHSPTPFIYCEICQAEMYLRIGEEGRWDCSCGNCIDLSPCQATTIVAEALLLVAVALFRESIDASEREMLHLIATIFLVGVALVLAITTLITVRELFFTTDIVIVKVYSRKDSERMGLISQAVPVTPIIISPPVTLTRAKPHRRRQGRVFGSHHPLQIEPSLGSPAPIIIAS